MDLPKLEWWPCTSHRRDHDRPSRFDHCAGITLPITYVFSFRTDAARGGLMSYGPNTADLFQRAAGYVDRILNGEKPADLPVQAPTKFDLAVC